MGFLRVNQSSMTSGFNGGKSQVNIEFASYAFINVIKNAGEDIKHWVAGPLFGAPEDPSLRDANGYPTSTIGWVIGCNLPSQVDRPGNWIQTWDGHGTVQNLITAVAYTITAATNAAQAVLTLNLATPVSPNTVTTSQLVTGQCIQLISSGWGGVSGNLYSIINAAVGGDPTKVQIDLASTSLGAFGSGQVKNSLTNTTTAGTPCIGRYVFTPPIDALGPSFPMSQSPGVSSMNAAPDYIRNMALYHGSDETAYLAGQGLVTKTDCGSEGSQLWCAADAGPAG